MPAFRCEQCGCVEDTACCNYWWRKCKGEPLICSECDPEIGKWHDVFEKRPADGLLIDQEGLLWSSEEHLPPGNRIVGKVPPTTEFSDPQGSLCNVELGVSPKEIQMTSGARVWAEEGCPIEETESGMVLAYRRDMTQAAKDVLAERRRQQEAEGWTAAHDDEHGNGTLAVAAGCYALSSAGWQKPAILELWPPDWAATWFKPRDRRSDLVKSAALILAEIERLDRLTPND